MARASNVRAGNAVGQVGLALTLAVVAQALVWQEIKVDVWRQVLGWALFIGAGFLLMLAWRRQNASSDQTHAALPRWAEGTGVGLILVLALFMRLHRFSDLPNAGYRDEGETGNVAISIMNSEPVSYTGTSTPVYIEEVYQNPAGYFYPVALSFKLSQWLGGAGVDMRTVRLNGVFWGVLSVLAFYFLARAIFGVPLALFLGFTIATLSWHVNFSRVGLIGIMALALQLPAMFFLWKALNSRESDALKRYPHALLIAGLALAFFSYFLPLAEFAGWGGFWIRAAMHAPLALALWKARHDERSRYFVLTGLTMGFCMYSYQASRLVMMACVFIFAAYCALERGALHGKRGFVSLLGLALPLLGFWSMAEGSDRRIPGLGTLGWALVIVGALAFAVSALSLLRGGGFFKGWGRPFLLTMGAAFVMAAPLNNYMIQHRDQMFSRANRVSIWNNDDYDPRPWGAEFKENVPRTWGMYNVKGDGNPRHNLPGAIMLNPVLAVLFALGLFFCLFQLRQPLVLFLMVWWQTHLIASYISIEAPQGFRTLASLPVVLLICAMGLTPLLWSLRELGKRRWRTVAMAVMALLALASGYLDFNKYFKEQPKHPGVWAEFSANEFYMSKELKALPNTRGIFRADWGESWVVKFNTYPERDFELFDVNRHVPYLEPDQLHGKNLFYVLDEAYRPLSSLLKSYYPHGKFGEKHHAITGEPIYWTYYVPHEDLALVKAGSSGLTARYYFDGLSKKHWQSGTQRIKRVDPFILYNWTLAPVQGYFSAEWTGSLKAPKDGEYGFHTYSNDIAIVEVDGKKVVDRQGPPLGGRWADGKIKLSAGSHRLRVRYAETSNYSRMELWWTVPGAQKEVVPSTALVPE